MNSSTGPRIAILGAGFAGVQAAQDLARLLPRRSRPEIILIDQNNFSLFTPMLIEVLGGQVDMPHILVAARKLSPRIKFIQGRIRHADLANKRVQITIGGTGQGDPMTDITLDVDHIVIALGSVPNFYGIPGLRKSAITMKNLCDAVGIRNRALALLERANAEPDRKTRRGLLTFIIGGGGFSGVETAAALHDLVHNISRYYENVDPDDHRIIIIEAMDRLLPELTSDLAGYALRKLEKCGIEVMLSTKVVSAGQNHLELDGREPVSANTIIWTGGVAPVSVVSKLGCTMSKHGGIVVEPTLAVPGLPGVWALGDCAEVPKAGSDRPYAPTAQNAVREGRLVARNIAASLRGKAIRPFTFRPVGELVALGRHGGVASVFGVHLSGFAAWFLWRTVYLLKLPHLSQRVRVGIDWALDLVFGRDIVEYPTQCFIAGICPAIEAAETQSNDHLTEE